MGRGGTLTLSPPECLYPADSRLGFAGPHARSAHTPNPSHSGLPRYVLRPLSVGYASLDFTAYLLLPPSFGAITRVTARLAFEQSFVVLSCLVLFYVIRNTPLSGCAADIFLCTESFRAISTARLKPLQALHLPPIHVVVFDGPYEEILS